MTDPNRNSRDDERRNEQSAAGDAHRETDAAGPEPPPNYDEHTKFPVATTQDAQGFPDYPALQEFKSTRRMITAAQIMSLVSLVIGGVVLSTAALIVAILGYRRILGNVGASAPNMAPSWVLLKKTAVVAIVMSCIALFANVATLILFYPAFIEMLQTGDIASYLEANGLSSGSSTSSGSFWG